MMLKMLETRNIKRNITLGEPHRFECSDQLSAHYSVFCSAPGTGWRHGQNTDYWWIRRTAYLVNDWQLWIQLLYIMNTRRTRNAILKRNQAG